MAGVTPQPVPIDFVARHRRIEPLPQIDVAHRLLVCGAPAVAFPDMDPFGDAAAHILAVGIKLDDAMAPLPRAYQWADGSAYVNHVELVRRARGATLPPEFWTDPLMYQGVSDHMLGAREDIVL